jgi:lysine-N-methylase
MFLAGGGVGSDDGAKDDVGRFVEAERGVYRSYMLRHPYVMENFLLNYIYQRLFPFGRAGGVHLRERGMFEEFVLMGTQFAWVETLLIGAAARDGAGFGGAQVVEVVQSFCRAVEHYPEVLEGVLDVMRGRGLDSLAGLAVMLRGAE